MKRIAELAGVSQSTVSRVLSGTQTRIPIADATRQRVLQVVDRLGYAPNPLAQALRGARTALLGLVVREIHDPFFAVAIDAVMGEAQRHGYSVVLGNARSDAREAVTLSQMLATRHYDGTLLLGDVRGDESSEAALTDLGFPVVGLCLGSSPHRFPVVNVDNRQGTRLALDYLYELGHRRIAFVQGGWIGDGLDRREAYLAYLAERGLPSVDGYLQPSRNAMEGGASALAALLALPEPPTAVFAASDVVAVGVLKAASAAGLSVPRDLSVVGFDDIPLAAFTIPALTTVHQPIQDMANLAVRQILNVIDDPSHPSSRRQLVEPRLVVRESCAPPPAGERSIGARQSVAVQSHATR